MNKYIGHENQIYGVEEMRLSGGKGDGMRLFQVRNGNGLEFTVSADRCADISRLTFKGDNFGFFAPCGYVSPQYYDNEGAGFLKSFTAGFLTTCGLTAVGSPCEDAGEKLPLHGTVSNTPCENISYKIENDEIHISAEIRDAALFSHHLILEREYVVPLFKNELYITDKVRNIGTKESPLQILYHCNIGYPLLDENTVLDIPAKHTQPRDSHAATGLEKCFEIESPQKGYEEMCYFHTMTDIAEVSVFNRKLKKGLKMIYDTSELEYFTEWKMMGEHEYVLGIEPGNCTPEGRDVMRSKGILETIKPEEERVFRLKFEFTEK